MDDSSPAQLAHSLHQLKIQQDAADQGPARSAPLSPDGSDHEIYQPRTPRSRDGYGFRKSGVNTPLNPETPGLSKALGRVEELVPDPNGLGWPGEHKLSKPAMPPHLCIPLHQPSLPSHASTPPLLSGRPGSTKWPVLSARFSNASVKTPIARVCSEHLRDMPKPSCG
jgi:hypothetical protein